MLLVECGRLCFRLGTFHFRSESTLVNALDTGINVAGQVAVAVGQGVGDAVAGRAQAMQAVTHGIDSILGGAVNAITSIPTPSFQFTF